MPEIQWALAAGDRVGPYEVLAPIGFGMLGERYRVAGPDAYATLILEVSRDAGARQRAVFETAAVRGSQLCHPGFETILDWGETARGRPYLVYTSVGVRQAFTDGKGRAPETVIRWGLGWVEMLWQLHRLGFAHGALDEAAFLLAADERPCLLTIGHLVPISGREGESAGTHADAGSVSMRENLEALGVLLHGLVTGRMARAGVDWRAVCAQEVSRRFGEVLWRMLAPDRGERFEDAEAVYAALLASGDRHHCKPTPHLRSEYQAPVAFEMWRARVSQAGIHGVWGAAGAGKTRFLQEAARLARMNGHRVLMVAAQTGDEPYALLARLWRQAVVGSGETLACLSSGALTGIRSVWPWASGAVSAGENDAVWAFDRAFLEVLSQTLVQGLGDVRVSVLIDDWDCADAESRVILEKGFTLGLDAHHWLLAARQASQTQWSRTLAPLKTRAAMRLLASASIQPVAPVTARQLVHACGGVPGWMMYALRQAIADDRRPWAVSAWQEAVWHALDATEQGVATTLAVLDAPLANPAWITDGPQSAQTVRRALDRLTSKGVLQCEATRWRFCATSWQTWILARLSDADRASLAARLGRRLASDIESGHTPGLVHLVARLFARGNDDGEALRWGLRAARWCQSQGANLSAVTHCVRALQRPRRSPEWDPLICELRLFASDARRVTGDWATALVDYMQVLEQILEPDTRLGILVSMAKCHQMLNQPDKARLLLRRACEEPVERRAPEARLRALCALARLELHRGAHRQAARHYRAVAGLAREVGAQGALAEALSYAGLRKAQQGKDGVPDLEEALLLRTRVGDALGLNDGHMMMGNAYLALGHYDAARAQFRTNLKYAIRLQAPQEQAFAHLNLALCEMAFACWGQAQAALEEARHLAQGLGDRFVIGLVTPLIRVCECKTAGSGKNARHTPKAVSPGAMSDSPDIRLFEWLARAEAALHHAEFETAWQAAQAADTHLARTGGSEQRVLSLRLLAEAAILSGRPDAAVGALKRLRRGICHADAWIPRYHLERLWGWYHWLHGSPARTQRHWRLALMAAQRAQSLVFEGQSLALIGAITNDPSPPGDTYAHLTRCLAAQDEPDWQIGLGQLRVRYLRECGAHGEADAAQDVCETIWHQWLAGTSTRTHRRLMRHPVRQLLLAPMAVPPLFNRGNAHHASPASQLQALRSAETAGAVLACARRWIVAEAGAVGGVVLVANDDGDWQTLATAGEASEIWRSELAQNCHTALVRMATDTGMTGVFETGNGANTWLIPVTGAERVHGFIAVARATVNHKKTRRATLELIAGLAAERLDALHDQTVIQQLEARSHNDARRLEEVQHVLARQLALESRRVAGLIADGHDLRAPLGAIQLSAQALTAQIFGPLTPDVSAVVSGMTLGVRQALLVVDTMLDTACLEAGRLTLNRTLTSLGTVLQTVHELLERFAAAKHLRLCWDRANLDALPQVWADERRVVQVVQNVVDNAIKYSTHGRIVIEGTCTASHVSLTVTDEGPGLSAARLKNPFERLGASVAVPERPGGSSGLGLWRVKCLMELHGGTVMLVPGPVGGTQVTLTLPVARGDRPSA